MNYTINFGSLRENT